ncbi:MAG: amidohydrolase [Deltaproteobacteria bacterium]|nr:amidohydrolase [Deltaproteobacteria bacterium]
MDTTFMAKRVLVIAAVFGLMLAGFAGIATAAEPEVIFFNAKIVTLDAAGSTAGAVAVQDGKVLKVGSADEIKKLAGPSTRFIDLGGKTVVPGLIDAHCHPMEAMMMKETWVDCRYPQTPSVKQALANIAAWAKKTPKGAWIFAACVSASENKFAEKRLPTKAELDAAAPDNPLLLANGTHMGVANSAALKKLGIKKGVERLPHGGSVILDKNGEPTGVLTDAQADVPTTPTVAELERYYTKEIQEFWNRHGFTSLLAITPAAALPVLQKAALSTTKPTIRYTTSIWTSANGKDMPADLSKFQMPKGADPAWYRFAGIKVWIDGENDCRTGYMYQPYVGKFDTDPPGGKGTLVTDQAAANRFAAIAHKAGVICMLHCSGDHATDIGLNAYDKVIKSGGPRTIMRIEHFGMFQLMDKQLQRAKEMKKKGLYISVQPTWLLDLVKANYENMGEPRTRTGFQFRAMIDAGLEPAAGSDVTGIYLDNINPFLAIYAAVTRDSDKGVFEPGQAISVTEALKMWTTWAAKSMGQADVKGSLEPGKYADMVVLSDDIFTIPKQGLKDVKVLKTIVGGNVVYEAK